MKNLTKVVRLNEKECDLFTSFAKAKGLGRTEFLKMLFMI